MSESRIWLIILTRSRENSMLGSAEKVKTLIWEEKKTCSLWDGNPQHIAAEERNLKVA